MCTISLSLHNFLIFNSPHFATSFWRTKRGRENYRKNSRKFWIYQNSLYILETRKKEDPSKRRNFKLRQNSNYISYMMKQHRRNCFFFFSSPAWTSNIQRERRDSRKKKGKRKSIKYAGTRVYLCNKILEKFEYLVLHSSLTPSPPSSPTPSRLKIFADPPGENYARCMGNRWER